MRKHSPAETALQRCGGAFRAPPERSEGGPSRHTAHPEARPLAVLVALPLKAALLAPLYSRFPLRLYASATRSNGGTLSAPQGLRSREGLCASPLCLKPALLPPFSALSAFLRPARRLLGFAPCSPLGGRAAVRHQRAPSLRHAPHSVATLRYATLRSAMRGYATLPGCAHASRLQHRPRCGPHGLKACAPAVRACAASIACTGVAARLCA